MTGTIINTLAVIAGGCIGLCIKKGLPEHINQAVTYMLGLSTGIIGLNGILSTMLRVDPAAGRVSSSGELLLLGSLALGTLVGELVERLEEWKGIANPWEEQYGWLYHPLLIGT